MKSVDIEEHVDWGVVPPDAHLAIACRCRHIHIRHNYRIGEGGQCFLRPHGIHEHVHVEIAGTAWLFGAVSQRDRTAEGVRQPRIGERIVHGKQSLTEQTHRASRASDGYSSAPRLREGSASARSRT